MGAPSCQSSGSPLATWPCWFSFQTWCWIENCVKNVGGGTDARLMLDLISEDTAEDMNCFIKGLRINI